LSASLITPELAAHFEGPTMTILSTRDHRFRATVGRGLATRYDADSGCVELFFTAGLWRDFADTLKPGVTIAATIVHPGSYHSFQVKGTADSVAPASETDIARARLHIERMIAFMATLGVTARQLSHILSVDELWHVRLLPTDVFAQTPGARAGTRVAGGAA
jgi:hypothetical protein